jgi:NifU-like protein
MAVPPEEKLVCRCFKVPEDAIRKAVAERGLRTVEEVTAVTRAGGGCGSCWDEIQALLDGTWGRQPPRDAPDETGLSAAQKKERIARMIELEIRPLFERNGLDVQLVDVSGDRALARFHGNGVGGTSPSYLALKRLLVVKMAEVCGRKMNLVELNVLEQLASQPGP